MQRTIRPDPRRKLSNQQIQYAAFLKFLGWTTKDLAAKYDVNVKTMRKYLRNNPLIVTKKVFLAMTQKLEKEMEKLKKNDRHNSQALNPYKGAPVSKTNNNTNHNPHDFDIDTKKFNDVMKKINARDKIKGELLGELKKNKMFLERIEVIENAEEQEENAVCL